MIQNTTPVTVQHRWRRCYSLLRKHSDSIGVTSTKLIHAAMIPSWDSGFYLHKCLIFVSAAQQSVYTWLSWVLLPYLRIVVLSLVTVTVTAQDVFRTCTPCMYFLSRQIYIYSQQYTFVTFGDIHIWSVWIVNSASVLILWNILRVRNSSFVCLPWDVM